MIIALSGPICSGKATIAHYLSREFDFKVVNFQRLFIEEHLGPVENLTLAHSELFYAGKKNFFP